MSRLKESAVSKVVVTDTIPDGERCDPIRDKLEVLTVARLLGDAVHRIHHDQSVSALFRSAVGTKR
jgi:ribose-phosphate pyrophosphokinase